MADTIIADQAVRDRIRDDLGVTLLIEAAAGTGKTTCLVGRMVALVKSGQCPVENMAAVTFTRKAAAELRTRFQVAIEQAARSAVGQEKARLASALGKLERCFIGTIHSFCGRLLRERPVEAGVDLAFEELDEDQDAQLRRRAWDQHVGALFTESSPLLERLDQAGLQVNELAGMFMDLAEYPDVQDWPSQAPPLPDEQVQAARGELALYLRHIEELAGSLPEDPGNDKLIPKYRELARLRRQADLEVLPELMDMLAEFEDVPKIVQKVWPGGREQAKAELARWEEFSQGHAQPMAALWRQQRYAAAMAAVLPALAVYDRLRRRGGCLNFQDLLLSAARLLRENAGVRRYFAGRFTHLLVDEFQDTDPVQAQVMLLLTASDPDQRDWTACRPRPGSLFVVGDPKQSIYRFRRADIVTYNQVRQIVLDTGGELVPLTANFRTLKPLVGWVNAAFSNFFPPQSDAYSPQDRPMDAARTSPGPSILTTQGLSDDQCLAHLCVDGKWNKSLAVEYDAERIARYIRQTIDAAKLSDTSTNSGDGTPSFIAPDVSRGFPASSSPASSTPTVAPSVSPGDFMILTAYTPDMTVYARKLHQYGLACEITGGALLNECEELRLLHACLAAMSRPNDPVALVALLRSELFGLDDQLLYRFAQAGGRFYYPAPNLPAGLEGAGPLEEAFARLRRYALWAATMPAAAAVERIVEDSGLLARACTSPDADLRAGSLLKALELLRAGQTQAWSLAGLVESLSQLVEGQPAANGAPAKAPAASAVRVMNLHKAKGLEAPVVFLADPTGLSKHDVKLHIARQGSKVQGYLALYRRRGFQSDLVACPAGWEEKAQEEQRFLQAERNRLLYVAATRAGAKLVVSCRTPGKSLERNPWGPLQAYLGDSPELADVPAGSGTGILPVGAQTIQVADMQAGLSAIQHRWSRALPPSYAVQAAKAAAIDPSAWPKPGASQPAGAQKPGEGDAPSPSASSLKGEEFGSVVHLLLESAMRNPQADLAQLARTALAQHELPIDAAGEVLELIDGVRRSDIWTRAQASENAMVEVPLLVPGETPQGLPLIVRAVIDLVFPRDGGWVIVDYKTDRAADGNLDGLAEHYAPQLRSYGRLWQQAAGGQVKELGLLFVRQRKYIKLPNA